jgi:hypothetical protein
MGIKARKQANFIDTPVADSYTLVNSNLRFDQSPSSYLLLGGKGGGTSRCDRMG